ncbi:coiled-coil domain-containing protein 15 [Dryobates pubescens]|uniref:coiled-coil domain-containing protein 15 n=1 Tax=Dryobates pubescens TaxID=118200 RepID=UPI0023B8D550|nr:coiled-coil domain-containing protein 15 [Dryobates pubescens]
MQYPGSALRLTARTGPCLCQSHPAALICGPGACTTQAQHQGKVQRRGPLGGAGEGPLGGASEEPLGGAGGWPLGGASEGPLGGACEGPLGGASEEPLGGAGGRPLGGASEEPLGGACEGPLGGASEEPLGGACEGPLGGASEEPLGGAGGRPLGGASEEPRGGAGGRPLGGASSSQLPSGEQPVTSCLGFVLPLWQLSRTTKQARLRLASCRTIPPGLGPPKLPGAVWRQESPEPCETPAEDEGKELLLAGHQDPPAGLQEQGPALPKPEDDFYIKVEFLKLCDGSVRDSSSPEPPQKPHTHCHTPLVLWAGVDQEETKKQRRRQQLRHRSLLRSIERQQVREQQRQQQRQRRVTQIKSKKEKQRWVEEQRLMQMAEQREPSPGEASESLAQLELEERRVEKAEGKEQRHKERLRYLEALRAQLREKMKLCHIDLPPLCSCGSSFWDSHPDSCANNCIFYKNHKAYRRALRSLLSSCQPQGRSSCALPPLRDLAAACGKRPGGAGRQPSSPPLPQPLL